MPPRPGFGGGGALDKSTVLHSVQTGRSEVRLSDKIPLSSPQPINRAKGRGGAWTKSPYFIPSRTTVLRSAPFGQKLPPPPTRFVPIVRPPYFTAISAVHR